MYFIYSTLLTLGAIVTLPYWILKGLRERKYLPSFRQRLGFGVPWLAQSVRPVWIHAVSVGEVAAAKPLLEALRHIQPDIPRVVSTVTLTGQAQARKELAGSAELIFFPFDWISSVRRVLDLIQPRVVVLLETEIWPNFLRACTQRGIPVMIANGRISDRSFGRYRRIRRWLAPILKQLAMIGVQTHEDRKRFLELGAPQERVRITGNLKFDFPAPAPQDHPELLSMIRSAMGLNESSPIIVIGSSMKGEETLFLDAFEEVRRVLPDARMILAPRHPERFDEVAGIISAIPLLFARRSQIERPPAEVSPVSVLLLDTIGELRVVYSLATVAVIGGSFLPFGGHNLLEPAALGKAIVFGPDMSNFKELARLFLREQAARQAQPEDLARALLELLQNSRARAFLGQRAFSAFRQNQGATENTLNFLLPAISSPETRSSF